MNTDFLDTLRRISDSAGWTKLNHGIEKEALRISSYGYLSEKTHPVELGASLTHPMITTDFSEAQLEFVTRVHTNIDHSLQELDDLHRFVYGVLQNERLWPASMPCMLRGESSIPLGIHGESNLGRVKTIYRMGLAHRYGRFMQSISGLHYNFSVPDSMWKDLARLRGCTDNVEFRNTGYFALIRNFRRIAWLPIYLFGASPAVCGSFISTSDHGLEALDQETFYLPYATSLRMGPLGYQSSAQAKHYFSFNSMPAYTESMLAALLEPYPPYEEIGLKDANGDYKQLSTSLIQIEAEAYGTIRPKPKPHTGRRPIEALNVGGIDYVEVRCLDLNPFHPTGIEGVLARFLDALLMYAWLSPSPLDSPEIWDETQHNQLTVVTQGRHPETMLRRDGVEIPIRTWAMEILDDVENICRLLDKHHKSNAYGDAFKQQKSKVLNPSDTPSARILEKMKSEGLSYYRLIDKLANEHQAQYLNNPLSIERTVEFEVMSSESLRQAEVIESAYAEPMDEYMKTYMKIELNT